MPRYLRAATLLAACSIGLAAGQAPPATAAIETTVKQFLTALNNADWESFRKIWTENPVVFHPAIPHRIDEQKAFDESWKVTIDTIRKQATARGMTQPPFFNLQAQNLRIDVLSPDIALATFHIIGGTTIGRRTLVLVKSESEWKIAHLHASNISPQKGQAP